MRFFRIVQYLLAVRLHRNNRPVLSCRNELAGRETANLQLKGYTGLETGHNSTYMYTCTMYIRVHVYVDL